MPNRVLVTGATGFVGNTLCEVLHSAGYIVRAATRGGRSVSISAHEKAIVGNFGATTDWKDALRDVDVVVHLAARAHILGDVAANAALYRETNADGTRRLAEASAHAGVRRFIYVSSVKVNGEGDNAKAYTASDPPCPRDPYGESKWVAEQYLSEVAERAGMQAAIVRPPLVYGPGVRANFLRLMSWVDRQWPIPLGAVDNRRSLVSVWNLCDLLLQLLENPAAAGRTWMVSDGDDLSTPQLIRQIGIAMGRHVRLWPIPIAVLRWGGVLTRRESEIARLCGSLTVDMSSTCRELRWSPPMNIQQGLARTVQWYLETEARRVA